ncbi:tape measure protein [Lactobacillus sp. R2/2]|nr:tape measure protein [Lactobacillus sp. R2/2]
MASTYSQLAAVGTKNTTQLVKGFGGLAAAATDPKQAMKTLSQQATQMAAKPTVQWQDFKLMLEQTPAGMAAVAKSMGMSTRQLVKQVQDGTIKTNQFLNAIAKTGTNANFSKMATQYKTVGQALDGLKETLANKVQPQFKKLSDIIIKEISKFTDKLGKVNFKKFADKLIDDINRVKKELVVLLKVLLVNLE